MAAKERKLKKYEAEGRAVVSEPGDPPMEFHSPFGPMIAKATLPREVIGRINSHVDGLVTPGAGQELILPAPLIFEGGDDSLAGCVSRLLRRYLAGAEGTVAGKIDPAEEQKTYISGRHAGYINFLIGGKQRFSKSLISFKPKVGDFYLFPGWLLHGAEPFTGPGERRSMSFNAYVAEAS